MEAVTQQLLRDFAKTKRIEPVIEVLARSSSDSSGLLASFSAAVIARVSDQDSLATLLLAHLVPKLQHHPVILTSIFTAMLQHCTSSDLDETALQTHSDIVEALCDVDPVNTARLLKDIVCALSPRTLPTLSNVSLDRISIRNQRTSCERVLRQAEGRVPSMLKSAFTSFLSESSAVDVPTRLALFHLSVLVLQPESAVEVIAGVLTCDDASNVRTRAVHLLRELASEHEGVKKKAIDVLSRSLRFASLFLSLRPGLLEFLVEIRHRRCASTASAP